MVYNQEGGDEKEGKVEVVRGVRKSRRKVEGKIERVKRDGRGVQ